MVGSKSSQKKVKFKTKCGVTYSIMTIFNRKSRKLKKAARLNLEIKESTALIKISSKFSEVNLV
jgi:hypothetical protein